MWPGVEPDDPSTRMIVKITIRVKAEQWKRWVDRHPRAATTQLYDLGQVTLFLCASVSSSEKWGGVIRLVTSESFYNWIKGYNWCKAFRTGPNAR